MSSRASEWQYGEYQQQQQQHQQQPPAASGSFDEAQQRQHEHELSSAPPLPTAAGVASQQHPQSHSHYYYAPASSLNSGGIHSSRSTMTSSYQPRQPPSLNIAAAAAAAAASTYDQQQQYHYHSASQHAHQPYSAPAFGSGSSSYFNSNGASFGPQPSGQQQQSTGNGGYAGSMSNGSTGASGAPFMLPVPQQSPAGAAYGGALSTSNGAPSYGGSAQHSNMHASHLHSAPHSVSNFHHHHRFNASATGHSDDISSQQGTSAYDFHHHHHQQQQQQQQQHSNVIIGGHHTNGAFDTLNGHGGSGGGMGHSLLTSHDFDANAMLPLKAKRKQVKNACINCQKACKRCDEGRPCSRCVKYGLTATCTDSARKERKRGIKRGPYKRRATTGSQMNTLSGSTGLYSAPSASMTMGGGDSSSSSSSNSNHGGGSHHTGGGNGNVINGMNFHGTRQQQQISNASQYAHPYGTHTQHSNAYHSSTGSALSPGVRSAGATTANGDGTYVNGDASTSTTTNVPAADSLHAQQQQHINSGALTADNRVASPSALYGREHAYAAAMHPPLPSASSRSYGPRSELDRSNSSGTNNSNAGTVGSAMSSAPSLSFYTNNARNDGGHVHSVSHLNSTPMQAGGHQPISAPATSSSFALGSSSTSNGGPLGLPSSPAGTHRNVTIPSLYSPSVPTGGSGGNNSAYGQATFLHANGHHRLHSDSSPVTLNHGGQGTTSSSHSPRTPMGGGGGSSTSSSGEMTFSAATMSSGSSSSQSNSNKSGFSTSMNAGALSGGGGGSSSGYVHHPDATTVASLAPGTAGAFLHPPSAGASNQPFPLQMPQSVRMRANGGGGSGYHAMSSESSTSPPLLRGDLAPLKLVNSSATAGGNSNAIGGHATMSSPIMRYQLPSPRTGVAAEVRARSYFVKMESGDVATAGYGAA